MQIRKFYESWIIESYDEFNWKPYVVEDESHSSTIIIQFQNVLSLFFRINQQCEAGMFVYECQRYWDIIWDCDLFPVKDSDGRYYCSECDRYRKSRCENEIFWDSEQEMWNEHVFHPLLRWCNKYITAENVLACYGIPQETTWGAEIIPTDQIKEYRTKGYNTFLPIINPYREKKEL